MDVHVRKLFIINSCSKHSSDTPTSIKSETTVNQHKMNTQNHELALANDSIPALIKRFAIPSVIGMISIGIQSIIDGLIVGNYLGANALTSVSLIIPLYSFVASIAIIIGIGSQTLVSVGQGKGDYAKAQNAMTTGYFSIIIFGFLASLLILLFSESTARLLGATDMVMSDSQNYMKGLFIFMIPISVAFYNDYMLRSMGHPKKAMTLMTLSVTLNIVLNILLITVFGWGTFGVGFATGISFTISAFASTVILQSEKNKIRPFKGSFRPKLLWEMFYNGSSEGVSELAGGVTIFLFNITLMKHLGESGVAAFTIINYIYFIGAITLVGVSDGVIPIISYNFGAKQYSRCKAVFKYVILVNAAIGGVIAIIMVFLGPYIIELFLDNSEQEIIAIATNGAAIYALAFLLNGFNILSASFFTATTDAKRSIIISSLRGIIFMSIAVTTIPSAFGIEYIWFAVPIAELATFSISLTLICNLLKRWKRDALYMKSIDLKR